MVPGGVPGGYPVPWVRSIRCSFSGPLMNIYNIWIYGKLIYVGGLYMDNLINDCEELNRININDIEDYIELFCDNHNINIQDIRPQQWTAIISYIGNNYIKPNNIIYINLDRIPYKRYNYFVIDQLLDIYISLCNIYSQSITILGFAKLSCIDTDIIYQWKNDSSKNIMFINSNGTICNNTDLINSSPDNRVRQLTIKPIDIYKKLLLNIEQNLNDMVIDNKRRGVGPIVRFNKFYETHSTPGRDHGKQQLNTSDLALQLGIDSKLLEIQEKKTAAGVLPGRVPGVSGKNK